MARTPFPAGPNEAAQVLRGHRLTWRWRWSLRRAGRTDGRLCQPDPEVTTAPATTESRTLLADHLMEAVQQIRDVANRSVDGSTRARYELIAERTRWQTTFDQAVRELALAERRRPDPTAPPVRKAGETDTSEEVVRSRRLRDHLKECDPIRRRRDDSETQLRRVAERLSGIDAELAEVRRKASDTARHLQATYHRARSVYDQALLRRHPLPEYVRHILDTSDLPLPAWVTQPADVDGELVPTGAANNTDTPQPVDGF